MKDESIIQKAFSENRILITNDKDFGEKVYREQYPHKGIVLLRLEDERAVVKIATLKRLLAQHMNQLTDNYVVVTEKRVRFARKG